MGTSFPKVCLIEMRIICFCYRTWSRYQCDRDSTCTEKLEELGCSQHALNPLPSKHPLMSRWSRETPCSFLFYCAAVTALHLPAGNDGGIVDYSRRLIIFLALDSEARKAFTLEH